MTGLGARRPTKLSREEARRFLVGHTGLAAVTLPPGAEGARGLLRALRCIQLDPLDPLGTNADLVAMARVDGLARGDVYRHLLPGHAFEHFAKERCLLPAEAFGWYRTRATEAPWWRLGARQKRLPVSVVGAVKREIARRGALSAAELTDHGAVEPLDWGGWKGTSRATSMALEILWTRCEVVVAGRGPGGKRYDLPERALGRHAATRRGDFGRWALGERVEAAGLLARAGGPQWSMLSQVRTSELPDRMVAQRRLESVVVEGSARPYLAPAGFLERPHPEVDERLRILGPLDPLVWDRKLVQQVFGFEYIWEVYKPAHLRRWGWYVCPLLHRGRFVGRLEGRIKGTTLVIDRIWREAGADLEPAALDAALERHAAACGATAVRRPGGDGVE